MFKIFRMSFLIVLLLTKSIVIANTDVLQATQDNNAMENNAEQVANQVNLVALSKEESEELLKNLSLEETALLNKFLSKLTEKLESLKEEAVVSELSEKFASKGISWNVTLSVYPCKPAPVNMNQELNNSNDTILN